MPLSLLHYDDVPDRPILLAAWVTIDSAALFDRSAIKPTFITERTGGGRSCRLGFKCTTKRYGMFRNRFRATLEIKLELVRDHLFFKADLLEVLAFLQVNESVITPFHGPVVWK